MSISDDYARIACHSIIIDRDDRQRKVIETDDLEPSIKARGVLNPIIVDRTLHLIAGERRLTASRRLGLPDIPIRYVDELSREERKLIELEENVKRRELPWRDEVAAYGELHAIYDAKSPDWTQDRTAQAIGIDRSTITRMLRVYEELANPKLAQCTSHSEAFNMLKRFDERRISNVMANILDGGHSLVLSTTEEPRVTPSKGIIPANATRVAAPTMFPESVFNLDFIQWSENYRGPKFNFIHCDFPYGIDVFSAEQSGKNRQATYADSPDDYWNLIEAFCFNRDKFISHSAHIMFWFSMDYYRETLEAFRKMAPDLEFQLHPVYWHKTDNVGILPDPQRGPRRVVETCLLASRGDRKIVRAKSNCYGCPTDKQWHTSTKPEPMLRHYMEMFVDENTIMLDPTCGGGSSLRAAESLGAKTVVGLEREMEHYENAQLALRQFRVKRAGARKMEEAQV